MSLEIKDRNMCLAKNIELFALTSVNLCLLEHDVHDAENLLILE